MTDYMNEAERLLEQYDDACLGIIGMSEEQARAALLAHIQRGAAPEGWQLVPIDPTPEMLDAAEKVDWGDEDMRGSCCNQWHAMLAAAPAPDELGDINVVDIAQAADATKETAPGPADDGLLHDRCHIDLPGCRAAKSLKVRRSPAEVPMPEPDYRGPAEAGDYFSGYTHTTMCAYGDARESAGYARGLREMLDCRTCRNYTRDGCIQTAQCVNGDGYRRAMPVRFWSAALRGEVKP